MKKIDTFVPHPSPHLDEVVLAVIILDYNAGRFDIDPKYEIKPRWIQGRTFEECLQAGEFPLGQLRGIVDDKDREGKRIPGECCALRMARHFGVHEKPELKHLLEETLRLDSSGTAQPLDLSNLIKIANDTMGANFQPKMFRVAMDAVRAVIAYKKLEGEKKPRKISLVKFFKGKFPNLHSEVQARLEKLLSGAERCGDLLNITSIANAMLATGVSRSDVNEFLRFCIDLVVESEKLFHEAIDDVAKETVGVIFTPWTKTVHKFVLVHSDNPKVAKAARAVFKVSIVAVRRSSGHVSILLDDRSGLHISMLRANVRLYETTKENVATADVRRFQEEGNLPEAPNWFCENGYMLNKHPYPITSLSDEIFTFLMARSFSFKGYELFERVKAEARRQLCLPVEEKRVQGEGIVDGVIITAQESKVALQELDQAASLLS